MRLLLLFCINIICVNVIANQTQFRTIYEWKYFDYKWKNADQKAAAIASGNYNYTKCVILDADTAKDGRIFITIIRSNGVPSSLNVISERNGPGGPLLQPYPDWTWTKKGDCKGITNVFRVAIDPCNRLWVLDNGKIEQKVICPVQVLVFNLATDKLIKRLKIPDDVARNSKTKVGQLVTIIVETHGSRCRNTIAYMADISGYGLVIYDSDTEKVWRLESERFLPNPAVTNYTMKSENSQILDGILGMAKHPNAPILYFKPMSSYDVSSARTTELKNSQYGNKVYYYTNRNVLPSQAATMAVSSDGILFFDLPTELSIGCWNTCKPFNKDNLGIVAYDPERIQSTSGIKIISKNITGTNEEIWIVTNRMQKVSRGILNFTDVNFRLMKADVTPLIVNTVCALPYS